MRTTKNYRAAERVLKDDWLSKMTGISPRDSDKELIIQVLQFAGCNLNAEQMTVIRGFNFESITRARRKLQEAGQYIPHDPEVARRRKIKSYEIQQTAPNESAGGLQRRIEEND